MGKPSAPQSPNYGQAAQYQGTQNKETAAMGLQLSNPDVYTPFGSRQTQYKYNPESPGGWTAAVTQQLSPLGQQRFDQQQRIDTGLGNLAETGVGYVQNSLNQPFDQSQLPEKSVNAGQTAQEAILSRIEPQIRQDREALRTQLTNQGLAAGGEAWDNSYRVQNQKENDLRMQAALQGINVGDTARQRAIQEQEFMRTEPLNILNAVRSASPVQMPQFQNWQGTNVASAPLFNAAQAQGMFDINKYGIDAASYNNMLQGLFGIGSAVAGNRGSS